MSSRQYPIVQLAELPWVTPIARDSKCWRDAVKPYVKIPGASPSYGAGKGPFIDLLGVTAHVLKHIFSICSWMCLPLPLD